MKQNLFYLLIMTMATLTVPLFSIEKDISREDKELTFFSAASLIVGSAAGLATRKLLDSPQVFQNSMTGWKQDLAEARVTGDPTQLYRYPHLTPAEDRVNMGNIFAGVFGFTATVVGVGAMIRAILDYQKTKNDKSDAAVLLKKKLVRSAITTACGILCCGMSYLAHNQWDTALKKVTSNAY